VRALLVPVACAALVLAGCGGDPEPETTPAATVTPTASGTPSETVSETASASAPPSADPGGPTTPVPALLAWEPTGRAAEETVTTGGGWTIVVDAERSLATLDGPHPTTVAGDKRWRIGDVLLDAQWAVVVRTDTLEQRPARATVVDLATGDTTVVDGRSATPTTTGGTWALDGSILVHATRDGGAYCLATRDLAAGTAQAAYCVEKRHGVTHARLTPAGLGVMEFDDARPSCRTLGTLADGALDPEPDAEECAGWEVVPTATGAVWTVIPREDTLDEAEAYAATEGGVLDLGPATSGSLTWCAGATYFVRDPQSAGEPARLLRWTDGGALETVYETAPGGQAFLDGPRCGGDRITLTAFAESGDQQVSAAVE
jgi:hypothetical protein